jgi:hypothetical protein
MSINQKADVAILEHEAAADLAAFTAAADEWAATASSVLAAARLEVGGSNPADNALSGFAANDAACGRAEVASVSSCAVAAASRAHKSMSLVHETDQESAAALATTARKTPPASFGPAVQA